MLLRARRHGAASIKAGIGGAERQEVSSAARAVLPVAVTRRAVSKAGGRATS